MKYILPFFLCSALFALEYQDCRVDGEMFHLTLSDGIRVDACNCGCPRDASEALEGWEHGDELEMSPCVIHPLKGQIFLIRNLNNGSEICTWIPEQKNTAFPTFVRCIPGTTLHYLSDGTFWAIDGEQPDWKEGDQILISTDIEICDDEHWLINVDHPDRLYYRGRQSDECEIPF